MVYTHVTVFYSIRKSRRGETFVTRKITRVFQNNVGLEKCIYLGNLGQKG